MARSPNKKSLALAKISRPKLSGAFPRERLFRLLDELRDYPVVWVCGPPGGGKTALVASYLEARGLSGIWYRLDQGDTDIASFFYYIGLAATHATAHNRTLLSTLTADSLPDLAAFSRRYFRELFSSLAPSGVLVFDDYQEASNASAFHAVIREALAEIPESVRVIVLSRTEPPPEIIRLSAAQRIQVVDFDKLRLTPEETRQIAAMKGVCDVDAVSFLHDKSAGWVAGLVLMLEQTGNTGATAEHLKTITLEAGISFFAGELFDSAAADSRDLLLRTAVLPHVTVEMAEQLTGNPSAGKLLAELRRQNFFTDRSGADKETYRYHLLFREFLLKRARQVYTPAQYAQIARRAAQLLEEKLKHAPGVIAEGQCQTLRDWASALPRGEIENHPWLLYWLGMSELTLDPPAARHRLEQAFERFAAMQDRAGECLTAAGIMEAYVFESREFTSLDPWIDVLEGLLTDESPPLSPEQEASALSSLLTALLHRQPRHPLLALCAERVMALLETGRDVAQQVKTGACLVHYYAWKGDHGQARRVVNRINLMLPDQAGLNPFIQGSWRIMQARLSMCLANPADAAEAIGKARGIIAGHNLQFMECALDLWEVDLHLNFGDTKAAEALIRQLECRLDPARRLDLGLLRYQQSWLALVHGKRALALKLGQEALDLSRETGARSFEAFCLSGLAQVLCECGEHGRALRCAREARAKFLRDSRLFDFYTHLIEACALLAQAAARKAHTRLHAALTLGRAERYMSSPRWLPKVMARLCAEAVREGIELEYVQDLIRSRGLLPESPEVEQWPWPLKIYTLGRFSITKDGRPSTATGKAHQKPLELLKGLLALGGREVNAALLTGRLWPDAEGDAAQRAFDTTLHRLRKHLGDHEIVSLCNGKLSLDASRCWVDIWALERALGWCENTLQKAPAASLAEVGQAATKILSLYRGHFLEREAETPWVAPMRERLRSKFMRSILGLGERYEQAAQLDRAAELYQRGIELDGVAELLYRRLMRCHRARGYQAEALQVYDRCRRMLSAVMGARPSPETERLYQALQQCQANSATLAPPSLQ